MGERIGEEARVGENQELKQENLLRRETTEEVVDGRKERGRNKFFDKLKVFRCLA